MRALNGTLVKWMVLGTFTAWLFASASCGGKAVFVAVEAPENILSPENVGALYDYVHRVQEVPGVTRVDSIVTVDPAITKLTPDAQAAFAKSLAAAVEKEGAGYDLAHYRDAPAGLRIWCGATVEAKDVELLTQWIDWAFVETRAALKKAA